jgi:peroxiredoxin
MTSILAPLLLGQAMVAPPKVGDPVPVFALKTVSGTTVRPAPLLRRGPVVLVVLRGYPGYQCPLCTRQVGEFLARSAEFEARKASVVLVYPGPATDLTARAKEFVAGKSLPASFHLAVDPDYRFTNAYGLRWDAPAETAYPSTFVVGRNGRLTYAKVSRNHGDRADAADVLAVLQRMEGGASR